MSSDLWFYEQHTPDIKLGLKLISQLHRHKSEYQLIEIFESAGMGRFLALDGVIMLTEKDEFVYHEMITHTAMAVNPDINSVLIIGGGDGGAVRELVKYPSIRHIDVSEIDEQVVSACRRFLPFTSGWLDDPRVNIHYQDGLKYIRRGEGKYDLIIVDSTDPTGPGEVLFSKEFYHACRLALNPRGVVINQHESPFYTHDAEAMSRAHARLSHVFANAAVYQAHIPSYPSGHWLFGFSSDTVDPLADLQPERWQGLGLSTRYYNTELHKGAFCLPQYVKELLNAAKK